MPDYGIRLERHGYVAIVTLDRPERRNAFDAHMWSELSRITRELEEKLPRVVVVTGSGDRAFCAGYDVNPDNLQVADLIEAVKRHQRAPAIALLKQNRNIVDEFTRLPVPVIAAVNGDAYGGGAELAIRCDLRVMAQQAIVCFSEVRLGLIPDWGGGVALTRLVGPARAADLILSARKIDAAEAIALGLTNRVCEPNRSLEDSIRWAEAISRNGPRSVRAALDVIRRASDLPIQEAFELETEIAADLIASGECIHGISAFLSKANPDFPEPEPGQPIAITPQGEDGA